MLVFNKEERRLLDTVHSWMPFTRGRIRMGYVPVCYCPNGRELYEHTWCIEFTNDKTEDALWYERWDKESYERTYPEQKIGEDWTKLPFPYYPQLTTEPRILPFAKLEPLPPGSKPCQDQ